MLSPGETLFTALNTCAPLFAWVDVTEREVEIATPPFFSLIKPTHSGTAASHTIVVPLFLFLTLFFRPKNHSTPPTTPIAAPQPPYVGFEYDMKGWWWYPPATTTETRQTATALSKEETHAAESIPVGQRTHATRLLHAYVHRFTQSKENTKNDINIILIAATEEEQHCCL